MIRVCLLISPCSLSSYFVLPICPSTRSSSSVRAVCLPTGFLVCPHRLSSYSVLVVCPPPASLHLQPMLVLPKEKIWRLRKRKKTCKAPSNAILLSCRPPVLLSCCPAILSPCCPHVLLFCHPVVLPFCCPALLISLLLISLLNKL